MTSPSQASDSGQSPDQHPPGPGARYRITHRTEYRYSDVVTSSYGRGFLTPRDLPRQRCLFHELRISPTPSDSSTSHDTYGNISSYFHVTEPHQTLTVTSESIVEVYPVAAGALGRRAGAGAVGARPPGGRARGAWPPSSRST